MTETEKDLNNEGLQPIQCSTDFSRLRTIKNIIVISVVFFMAFTAYDCLSMLQSTMNHDEGVGVVCQSIIYGGFCFSSLLFPKYIIQKFGCKRTLVVTFCLYVPYIASNLYPHWSFMVPTATASGLVAPLLWGAQCIYLNEVAVSYAMHSLQRKYRSSVVNLNLGFPEDTSKVSVNKCSKQDCNKVKNMIKLTDASSYINSSCSSNFRNIEARDTVSNDEIYYIKGKKNLFHSDQQNNPVFPLSKIATDKAIESTIARVFGIFGMAYLSSHIWSNLISYFILQNDALHSQVTLNASCVCGAQFCNENSDCFVRNLLQPSEETRNFLTGLCISITIIAILILAIFLDPLNDKRDQVKFSLDLVMATYEQSKKKKQILLIPFTFYIGMMQGFYSGDFTMSYVGCAWGTYHVGLVSICYGTCCALFSPLSGWVMQRAGRPSIFLATAVVNIAAQILLLLWKPTAESPMMFFLIAGLWGAANGVLWSQLKAMYGVFFKDEKEAAFAAYHLWYSLGVCLSFGYSNHLCTYLKIYLLISVLILGMIGYIWVELLTKREMKK